MPPCFQDNQGTWWVTESVTLTSATDILEASRAMQSGNHGAYGKQTINGVDSYFKNQTRRATDSDLTQALNSRNRQQRIEMLFGSDQNEWSTANTTFDNILSKNNGQATK